MTSDDAIRVGLVLGQGDLLACHRYAPAAG
jgi:hypothetical protein